MALTSQGLASSIKSKMDAIQDNYKQGEKSPDDAYQALAEAIVTYITANADVVVTSGSSAGTYKVA